MAQMPYEFISDEIHERRERVFIVLASFFIGSLAMLNILGITRFIDLSFQVGGLAVPFSIAVGVLPYPITFLCTDFISELYGRKRANFLVFMGILINIWIVFILWIGGALPGFEAIEPTTGGLLRDEAGRLPVFYEVRQLTFGAVIASMIAYAAAQFCDVFLFHFWKRLTRGRHLWLRNNASTMVSQAVDTVAVIMITHYYAAALPVNPDQPLWPQLWVFILSGYTFKLASAMIDTIPMYVGVRYLSRYLHIDPYKEHAAAPK
jgi:queuosine precursor transporter